MQATDMNRNEVSQKPVAAFHAVSPLSAKQFQLFRSLVAEYAGIDLLSTKQSMVQRRLSQRLSSLKLSSFEDYAAYLTSGHAGEERVHFINALTTNKTEFFREAHHFDYLSSWLSAHSKMHRGSGALRMWSAGCSTGQEPYSMAMTAAKVLPALDYDKLRILATDVDTQVLQVARHGRYGEKEIASLPQNYFREFAEPNADQSEFRISQACRSKVTYNQLNLNGAWPITIQFDVIFCRNVIIYFSKQTQALLFEKFAQHLKPDGCLFLGHSESIFRVSDRFVHVGQNIYRKAA